MSLILYYGAPASNSLKCLLALKEKELAFEARLVNLLQFEQHEPAFLAINPDGEVPVLDHDGFNLSQSSVINEYLEDAFPKAPALRPASPQAVARMRVWNKFIDEHVWSYVSLIAWSRFFKPLVENIEPQRYEALIARIPLYEKQMKWRSARSGFAESDVANAQRKVEIGINKAEAQLSKTLWLAGDTFTLADINLFADLGLALGSIFSDVATPERCPHLLDWAARMHERPATKAVLHAK